MIKKLLLLSLLLVMVVALNSALANAQEKQPKMDPEMLKQMEIWMKYATPGPHHAHLKQLEGTWDTNVKMWMQPGAPPEVSTGTSEAKLILGGRYVLATFKGTYMEKPFEGLSITGYDNAKKEYVSLWIDTMGTGFMLSTGKCDQDGKVFTANAEMFDPVTNKIAKSKGITKIIDKDKHVDEMFMIGPDGKEVKTMEITYTRKK